MELFQKESRIKCLTFGVDRIQHRLSLKDDGTVTRARVSGPMAWKEMSTNRSDAVPQPQAGYFALRPQFGKSNAGSGGQLAR